MVALSPGGSARNKKTNALSNISKIGLTSEEGFQGFGSLGFRV